MTGDDAAGGVLDDAFILDLLAAQVGLEFIDLELILGLVILSLS